MDSAARTRHAKGLGKLTVKYFPGQILPGLIAFLAVPFLTRLFTQDQYGYYILILTTVTTVSSLAFAWVANCALRFYRSLEADVNKLLFHLFFSTLLTAAIIAAVAALIWVWLPERYQGILLISGPLILFLGLALVLANVLRAQSRALAFSSFQSLNASARFLPGIAVLVWISSEVNHFVVAWSCAAFAIVVFLMVLTRAGRGLLSQKPDKKLLRDFFHYGMPITVVSVMAIIMRASDRFIIDLFQSSRAVAIYGLSNQLGGMSVFLIARAIMMAVLPRAIDAYEEGEEYGTIATRGLRYFVMASFAILPIIGVPAPEILLVYAGAGYDVGANVLRLVMIAIFLMSLAHYFRMPFLVSRQMGALLIIGGVPAALVIVLNLILVPVYGSLGSAFALVTAYSLMVGMSIYFSRGIVRIQWPTGSMVRSALGATAVLSVALATRHFMKLDSLITLVLVMSGWMVVYILVLYASGEIRTEVHWLWKRLVR